MAPVALRWGERILYWLAILALATMVIMYRRATLPVALFVNGEPVAWVSNIALARQALAMAREELRKRYGEKAEFAEAVDMGQLPLRPNASLVSPSEAAQQLLRRVTPAQQAWLIVVNGQPMLALPTKEEAEQALELTKAHFTPPNVTLVKPPTFKEKVVVRQGKIAMERLLTDAESAAQKFISGWEPPQYHRVQQGEFAIRIARRYNLTLDELQKLNPHKDLNRLKVGDQLLVRRGRPLVTVVCVYQVTEKVPVPFKTERRFAPTLPGGALVTKQRGREGEKEVVVEITCENGEEVDRKVVQERLLREPVTEVILVGGGLRP